MPDTQLDLMNEGIAKMQETTIFMLKAQTKGVKWCGTQTYGNHPIDNALTALNLMHSAITRHLKAINQTYKVAQREAIETPAKINTEEELKK